MLNETMTRCPWVPLQHPLYVQYHDEEWGVPSRDPRHLFEMICLEGAQAGLSWWTILQKRRRYKEVFHNFHPEKIAAMTDADLESLLQDPGIVRHRGKIFSVRQNARAWQEIPHPADWLWSFINDTPIRPKLPGTLTNSPESAALSKSLSKAGFNFVGATTMHAFMQATGMVSDHSADCFRRNS